MKIRILFVLLTCGSLLNIYSQSVNLVINQVSTTELALYYNASQANSYTISRSNDFNGVYEFRTTTSSTSYIDTGLEPGTCYFYKVTTNMGESSDPVEGCTEGNDPLPTKVYDIKGEASIYMDLETNSLTLKNYEHLYEIPNDYSFVLYSSSYVYLTIETDVEIPMAYIDIAGDFHIKINEEDDGINPINSIWKLASDGNTWPAYLKAGRLEILGPGTLTLSNTTAAPRDYGLLVQHSITLDGNHSLTFPAANKYGVKAGGFVKLAGGAALNVSSDSIGIYSNSHIMLDRAALLTAKAVHEKGAGILLEGNDTGIFMTAVNATTTMNVQSDNGCAVKINGNGSIIAKGNYEGNTWSSQLIATGSTGGIYLTGSGYVKADGAFIQGTRTGVDGNISAVHAPHNLYSVNQGKIEEIYQEANLKIGGVPYDITRFHPAVGNNMKNVTSYVWAPSNLIESTSQGLLGKAVLANAAITAERTIINNKEYTKVDSIGENNKSTHKIVLNGNSITNNASFTIYWIHDRHYSDLEYYYNFDVDAFLNDYASECCDITEEAIPANFIINPLYYLQSKDVPIPFECSRQDYTEKMQVYPRKSFNMTGNDKIIIFLYQVIQA